MVKWFSLGFWELVARIVLRNKTLMLILVAIVTALLVNQWKNIRFSFTEANLLPADDPTNVEYNAFLQKFGEEGNLIVIGIKDSALFTPKVYGSWSKLMTAIENDKNVDLVVDIHNLKKLTKNDSLRTFELTNFTDAAKSNDTAYLQNLKKQLFKDLPFYEGLLFNKGSGTVRAAVYLDKKIVNTKARKDFVLEKLVPALDEFKKETGIAPKVSGMPYIRTMSTETIKSEMGIFIVSSLLITSLLFFFFFRSVRATLVSMFIVIIGVIWSFGFLGLFNYEITVLTALVPALIIVIGIPNCIFLTNKYHQEFFVHRNKVKALQRVTTKIGAATLMTNVTTAIGFATFITSNNKLLIEFGNVTAVNIIALFFLSLIIIPIFHSYIPSPKERHLRHLERGSVKGFMDWILDTVKHKRISIYLMAIGLLVIALLGMSRMRISGSLIEDMPKKTEFFKDIVFFEKEFDGVMPLEIMVDTKRPKGVLKLSTLNRMEEFEKEINEIPELSKPISVVSLVKYSKQAYYNGNPEYFELPTSQEQSFILSYAKNAAKGGKQNLMKAYVDSTGRYARITAFMRDDNGNRIPEIEKRIKTEAAKLFPKDRFEVTVTGKSLVFQKGTGYLLDNLLSSLLFAFFLTALLVAFMFRSVKMVLVSLIPNMLPLLLTAGIMGFLDIPLKPSTILVFGIAFGLSVDDTLRFLAQYREELKRNNWRIRRSVYATFNDAGLSMFYTSIVLFFGFSVFMLSDFGGTVALGGLVSLTLFCGMLSNLMLLPALVLTLNKSLITEQEMRPAIIDIAEHTDDEIESLPGHKDLG
ncbi:MMPL family transporter [Flavobacterium sp. MAH-1]|uniref:MMPL family transporter n=1 Tax=Flavobacterium agri TaxID=2743471 RepID=A0A7Y9C5N4_9FLAO|nr:MMPL family transporter [Flavobacterium agri]NUY80570.1 MMPL family transporter [Flavobacterium agri]NYA70594.1 MMPL family transporter [Flavobacterium agri]